MPKFYDTLIGEYIRDPGKTGLSLDKLSERFLNFEMKSYKELTDDGKINFRDIHIDDAKKYSGEDVYITKQIYDRQVRDGISSDNILNNIEIPLLLVLKDMERDGVKISSERLDEIGSYLKQEILKEETQIIKLAGEEFNIKSNKQTQYILYEKLGLPRGKKTKTGYSVDSEALEYLSLEYPIAHHINNYRGYTKLLSTYIEGLKKLIKKDTSKVHTSYNQTIASTGRLSSTNPNLQNIPTTLDEKINIRSAFIPFERDDMLMSFDYSQVEVRILAIISGDDHLIDSFKNNIDIHYNTAKFIFHKDDINSEERKIAKAVNFGVIYGISPFGLSKMINSSQKDAKTYIDKFYETYPKVKEYFDKTIRDAEKTGYVETMFKRRRYIENINDRNAIRKNAREREAINMPIQGSRADIIKIAMIEIYKFLSKNKLHSKMIMQVHDELIFNVIPSEIDIIGREIPKIMEEVIDREIELKVDMSIGKNWSEL